MSPRPVSGPVHADLEAWANSGAMALTGRSDGPALGPPAKLAPGLAAVGRVIAEESRRVGAPVDLDPLALLGERAALMGLRRHGTVSCGGHTRLLAAADGWIALSLARPDDIDLMPPWLQVPMAADDPWPTVSAEVSTRDARDLVARGRMLGLPVAELPPVQTPEDAPTDLPVRVSSYHGAANPPPRESLTVVDLSSLWAGPLCGSVLRQAGATVVKVESVHRPDAMRDAQPAFFDLINGGKRSVLLDLRRQSGRDALHDLLATADVVIEASRVRALAQLGLPAERFLVAATGPRVWVSITGYGRRPPGRDWVAFGDDAAVAGGLVVYDGTQPLFCADAIADPASGLVAAAAALRALGRGERCLIDVAMAEVTASLAGPTLPVPAGLVARPPYARPIGAPARPLGADTQTILMRIDR